MNLETLGITREEILDLAVKKLCEEMVDIDHLETLADKLIREKTEKYFAVTIAPKADAFISAEMERLLSTEVVPVDIFGDKTGAPTTIRAAMVERARNFWNQKVNKDGNTGDTYDTKPRHEWMFKKIAGETFDAVIKQNLVNLCGSFKDALTAKAAVDVKTIIDGLIKVDTSRR